jgi:hypothetical protein
VDERGKGRLVVAARRIDNSPAFQCRVQSINDPSPAGTTDVCKSKSLAMAETEGHAFTGTGALPGNVPAVRSMAVWGGRMGKIAFDLFNDLRQKK